MCVPGCESLEKGRAQMRMSVESTKEKMVDQIIFFGVRMWGTCAPGVGLMGLACMHTLLFCLLFFFRHCLFSLSKCIISNDTQSNQEKKKPNVDLSMRLMTLN
jgi:hypothetical protein